MLVELLKVGEIQVGAEVAFVSTVSVSGEFSCSVGDQRFEGGSVVGSFDKCTGGSVGSSGGSPDELVDEFSLGSRRALSSFEVGADGGEGHMSA